MKSSLSFLPGGCLFAFGGVYDALVRDRSPTLLTHSLRPCEDAILRFDAPLRN